MVEIPDIHMKHGRLYVDGDIKKKSDSLMKHEELAATTSKFLKEQGIDKQKWIRHLYQNDRIDEPSRRAVRVDCATWLLKHPEQVKKEIRDMQDVQETEDEVEDVLNDFPDDEVGELARRKWLVDKSRDEFLEKIPVIMNKLTSKVQNENSMTNIKKASTEIRNINSHLEEIESSSESIESVPVFELEERLINVVEEANKEAGAEDTED